MRIGRYLLEVLPYFAAASVILWGLEWTGLLGDVEAVAMSRSLGNRYEGLPFTVVAEPGGNVVLRHTGGLERDQLEPLLRELTGAG